MSAMILCRGKVADNPLYIMQSGIRLYTEEELCYYIYNNIYIPPDRICTPKKSVIRSIMTARHEYSKSLLESLF